MLPTVLGKRGENFRVSRGEIPAIDEVEDVANSTGGCGEHYGTHVCAHSAKAHSTAQHFSKSVR